MSAPTFTAANGSIYNDAAVDPGAANMVIGGARVDADDATPTATWRAGATTLEGTQSNAANRTASIYSDLEEGNGGGTFAVTPGSGNRRGNGIVGYSGVDTIVGTHDVTGKYESEATTAFTITIPNTTTDDIVVVVLNPNGTPDTIVAGGVAVLRVDETEDTHRFAMLEQAGSAGSTEVTATLGAAVTYQSIGLALRGTIAGLSNPRATRRGMRLGMNRGIAN